MLTRDRYPYYLANRPLAPNYDLPVTDKYSGAEAARVALADAATIEAAIAAAAAAAPALRAFRPDERRTVLEHCVRRFGERAEELAQALTIEAGKPIRDARGEVTRLIDTFRVAAAETLHVDDGAILTLQISPRAAGTRGWVRRVPIGPVSLITPFNFPLNLAAHKVAPAIAAGCPFILKPSERTPLGALLIGEVLAETALPEGAFSVLPCRLDDVGPLIEDERLKLLSFTGSTVGWKLRERAGKKRVVLELGGNAACIVDGDQRPQLDHVIERLVFGAFYQSGQSCISVQRILAHASLYDELRERLVKSTRALKAGDPKDEATLLGPLIDEAAAMRLEKWIAQAQARGARLLCGGGRKGAMFDAAVLENVPDDEPLSADEAFGPVVLLEPFDDFTAALTRVNRSRFGLQAGVFSDNLGHALAAWDTLEVGGVIVGDVPSFRVDNMPYGGIKDSGVGREGVRSAIEHMTEERLLVIRG